MIGAPSSVLIEVFRAMRQPFFIIIKYEIIVDYHDYDFKPIPHCQMDHLIFLFLQMNMAHIFFNKFARM